MKNFIRQQGPDGLIEINSLEWHLSWEYLRDLLGMKGVCLPSRKIQSQATNFCSLSRLQANDGYAASHLRAGYSQNDLDCIVPCAIERKDNDLWFYYDTAANQVCAEPRYKYLDWPDAQISPNTEDWSKVWKEFVWFTDCGMRLGPNLENPDGVVVFTREVSDIDDLFTGINDETLYGATINPYRLSMGRTKSGARCLNLTFGIEPRKDKNSPTKHFQSNLEFKPRSLRGPVKSTDPVSNRHLCLINGAGAPYYQVLRFDGENWLDTSGNKINVAAWAEISPNPHEMLEMIKGSEIQKLIEEREVLKMHLKTMNTRMDNLNKMIGN